MFACSINVSSRWDTVEVNVIMFQLCHREVYDKRTLRQIDRYNLPVMFLSTISSMRFDRSILHISHYFSTLYDYEYYDSLISIRYRSNKTIDEICVYFLMNRV